MKNRKRSLKYFALITDNREMPSVEEFFLLYPEITTKKHAIEKSNELANEFCERHNVSNAFIMLGRCEFIEDIDYIRRDNC